MFLMFFLYRLELSLWNKNINIRNGYASAHTTKYPLDCKTVLTWILKYPIISDESEPSWLKPELKLKNFQLGLARNLHSSGLLEPENYSSNSSLTVCIGNTVKSRAVARLG